MEGRGGEAKGEERGSKWRKKGEERRRGVGREEEGKEGRERGLVGWLDVTSLHAVTRTYLSPALQGSATSLRPFEAPLGMGERRRGR